MGFKRTLKFLIAFGALSALGLFLVQLTPGRRSAGQTGAVERVPVSSSAPAASNAVGVVGATTARLQGEESQDRGALKKEAQLSWRAVRQGHEADPLILPTRKDVVQYVHQFRPQVSCASEKRVGGNGDGGKWVCAPHLLLAQEPDCLVYSFGSRLSFEFEDGVHKLAPHCEIHVFDPTPSVMAKAKENSDRVPTYVQFHGVGLTAPGEVLTIEGQRVLTKTLDEIVESLHHRGRRIALLKIDIESSENMGLIPSNASVRGDSVWYTHRIGQLLIEVHPIEMLGSHPELVPFRGLISRILDSGLRLFHNELNMFASFFSEFAFLDPSYRTAQGDTMEKLSQVPYTREQHQRNLADGLTASKIFRQPANDKYRTTIPFVFDRFEALYLCPNEIELGTVDNGGGIWCDTPDVPACRELLVVYDHAYTPVGLGRSNTSQARTWTVGGNPADYYQLESPALRWDTDRQPDLLEHAAQARWPAMTTKIIGLSQQTPLLRVNDVADVVLNVLSLAEPGADSGLALKISITPGWLLLPALTASSFWQTDAAKRVDRLHIELHVCDWPAGQPSIAETYDAFMAGMLSGGLWFTHREVNIGAIRPASDTVVHWAEHCHWSLSFVRPALPVPPSQIS